MNERHPQSRWNGRSLAYLGVPVLVILAYTIYLWRFSIDDVGITWRYARHLATGHGLNWNFDGTPVEGYSNFLWVLILAVPAAFGADIETASKILGVLFSAASLLLFALLLRRVFPQSRFWWAPLWILAITPEWTLWTVSGLEIASYSFFLLLALVAMTKQEPRRAILGSIAMAGLTLTRPEGFAVGFVMLAMHGLAASNKTLRARWQFVRTPFITLASTMVGLVGFRLWYFGYPLPNTVYAKFSTFLPSAGHVGRWMIFVSPLIVLAAIVYWKRVRDAGTAANAAPSGASLVTNFSGESEGAADSGSIMLVALVTVAAHTLMILPVHPVMNLLHRYHVALLPFWLLAVPPALDFFARRSAVVAVTAVAALLVWFAQGWPPVDEQFHCDQYQQKSERCVVETLRELPGRPTIAVVDAGRIPYWSDLPAIDVAGLCDLKIARGLLPQLAVMQRAPDVYITSVDEFVAGFERPRLGADKQMYQTGNFASVYRLWRPCVIGERPGKAAYDYAILVLTRWARDQGVRIPERKEFYDKEPPP